MLTASVESFGIPTPVLKVPSAQVCVHFDPNTIEEGTNVSHRYDSCLQLNSIYLFMRHSLLVLKCEWSNYRNIDNATVSIQTEFFFMKESQYFEK